MGLGSGLTRFVRVTKHYPGGQDHDQANHGRRAEGSSITWEKRPKIPVVNVKHDKNARLVLGEGDAWIVTVEETADPVIAFRGMTTLTELRDGLTPAWPKWKSRGHVVHLEAEKGTSFGRDPDETFKTSAIGSWVTGEYEGELYAVQVAADLRGLVGVTLKPPGTQPNGKGKLDALRGLGLSIIEDIPIDRIVAIRVIEDYWDYRDEVAALGPRPTSPSFPQVSSQEYSEIESLRQMNKPYKRKQNALKKKEAAWSQYWDDKGSYNKQVREVSNRYKDNGHIEFRGPAAHDRGSAAGSSPAS